MKFVRNKNNRIELINQDGKIEEFTHPIDARQALMLKDSGGELRYKLPEMKKEKAANIKVAEEAAAEEAAAKEKAEKEKKIAKEKAAKEKAEKEAAVKAKKDKAGK